MKLMILAQIGGTCPPQLLNTIAREALPMLRGERGNIRFNYCDCAGIVTTKGVYTNYGALFGLIVTAEVEHEELNKKITVRMVLSPKLRKEDLLSSPDDQPSPRWIDCNQLGISPELDLADLERSALN